MRSLVFSLTPNETLGRRSYCFVNNFTGVPKMRRTILVFLAIGWACSAAAVGCTPQVAPVYNIYDAEIQPWEGTTTLESVGEVIRAAVQARGWTIREDQPGRIVASTVAHGGHTAAIQIDYDTYRYSITHLESSDGLLYDGSNIHRRYNHWVRLLDEMIQYELRWSSGDEGGT